MNIRFYNAKILTMKEAKIEGHEISDSDIIEGQLWVEGNRITYVGPDTCGKSDSGDSQTDMPSVPVWDREIDVQGNLIMPGFKDAHTHSGMTFLRSYADDLPLQEWLNQQIFPMEAKLEGDDVIWLSKLAIMEYLTSGITSNFDMYIAPEMTARSSAETGFRTVIVTGLNDFVSSPEALEENYIKYNNYSDLVSYVLGFHAEYTTCEERLKKLAELAHKYQAPVFTHISETQKEVEECVERHGATPPVYLDSLGMFDYGGGGYHCVYFTEEDKKVFKKHNLSVVTNPASNLKLASGIAPISAYLKDNINVAIGTDGPASNNCLDMFREMFLVTGLAKLRDKDAAAVPADQVLRMATVGGAKAMGLTECDTLEVGKLADLILIDLHQPNMQPINNIVKNLVYSGSKQNVALTMVDGAILYEDGCFFIGEEPETVYRKANEIIERMK